MNLLDMLVPEPSVPPTLNGLLGPDAMRDARRAGGMATAAALLKAGGPHLMPGNFGAGLGEAMTAGQNAQQQSLGNYMQMAQAGIGFQNQQDKVQREQKARAIIAQVAAQAGAGADQVALAQKTAQALLAAGLNEFAEPFLKAGRAPGQQAIRTVDLGDRIQVLDAAGNVIREMPKGSNPAQARPYFTPMPLNGFLHAFDNRTGKMEMLRGPDGKPIKAGGAKLSAAEREKIVVLRGLDANVTRARQMILTAQAQGKQPIGNRFIAAARGGMWARLQGAPDAASIAAVANRIDPDGAPVRAAITELASAIINARSGAAVSDGEFARLQPFVPDITDEPEVALSKLNNLKETVRLAIMERERVAGGDAFAPLMPMGDPDMGDDQQAAPQGGDVYDQHQLDRPTEDED